MEKIYTAPDGKKYRTEIAGNGCAGCAFENDIKCEKAPRYDSSNNKFIPGKSIIFIEISQTYNQNIERLRLLKTLMPATEYTAFIEVMLATAMTPDEDRKANFIEEFINEKIQSYENKTY